MSQNRFTNHCYVCVLQQDIITLTHSRRDLWNVMYFEFLQLGDLLRIMSVK